MSTCADAFCGQSKNHIGYHDDFPLPVPEAPATNDPLPERDATPDEAFELGRIAGYDEAMREVHAEVPADEGTLALARKFAEWHDQTEETWRDHLDTAAMFATELQKARAEGYADGVFDGAKAQSQERGAS